jgi:hypothetical protein
MTKKRYPSTFNFVYPLNPQNLKTNSIEHFLKTSQPGISPGPAAYDPLLKSNSVELCSSMFMTESLETTKNLLKATTQ